MGMVRMGPPDELIEQITKAFAVQNFIETGTRHGHTAVWASQYFSKVFSIDYSQTFYSEAVKTFGYIKNIEFIFGDSRKELSKLLEQLEGVNLFWLDAHWDGDDTSYGETDPCPLLEEIRVLNHYKRDDFILIDDARLFISPPPFPHKIEQWPDIASVIQELQSGKSGRYIVIIDDVIVSVPDFAKESLASYCQTINTKSWQEYGRQLKMSNFKKGIELIFQDIKQRFRILKRLNT